MSILIPNNVTVIAEYAFYSCSSLQNVTIGNSVMSIGEAAFQDCTNLMYVSMSNSVTSIDDWAFKGCTSLKDITIATSVTSIGDQCFYGCTKLENVSLPTTTTTIGEYAFGHCTNLKSIILPNKLTNITKSTFKGCESLSSVVIPNGIEIIEDYAFESCSSLTSILFPESVASIGSNVFYGCNLLSITFCNKEIELSGNSFELGVDIDNCWAYYVGNYNEYNVLKNKEIYLPYTRESENGYVGKVALNYTYTCSHQMYELPAVSPTCTMSGVTEGTRCSLCGNVFTEQTKIQPLGHSYDQTVISPTCTISGFSTFSCLTCNYSYIENIEPLGHTWSDWLVVFRATDTEDGLRERECSVCNETETEIIPKLAQTIKDFDSGIEVIVPNAAYNADMVLNIEKVTEGGTIQFDGMTNSMIYDITITVNGVETQPSETVTVKIPLPAGYNPDYTTVYHINDNGELENMNARYENGYLVFETSHFSYYAVVETEPQYTLSIQEPSRTTIRCKDGIVLHANVEGTLPEGAMIVWSTNNNYFKTKQIDDDSFQIISNNNGYTTITVSIVDADGNVLASDSVEMYSKAGFGDKIGGFFRSLFGATKIYDK